MKYDPLLGEIETLGSTAQKINEAFDRVLTHLATSDNCNSLSDTEGQPFPKLRPLWAGYQKRFAHLLWTSRETALVSQPYAQEFSGSIYPQVQGITSQNDYLKALTAIKESLETKDRTGVVLNPEEISNAVANIQTQFVVIKQLNPPTESQTVDLDEICKRLDQFCFIWSNISDDIAKIHLGLKAVTESVVDEDYTPQSALRIKGLVRSTKDLVDKVDAELKEYASQMDQCGVAANLSATLAADAIGIYEAFKGLNFTAIDAGHLHTKWQLRWHDLTSKYFALVITTSKVTASGSQYLTDFKAQVSEKLKPDETFWRSNRQLRNKQLLSTFTQDARGEELKALIQTSFSGFTALRREVESFKSQFFEFAATEGDAYATKLSDLRRKMDGLQTKIAGSRTKAMSVEKVLKQIPGVNPVFPWAIAQILRRTIGVTDIDQARRMLVQTYQTEKALQSNQDTLAREVNEVVARIATLWHIQNALTMITLDIIDITPRFERFALTWLETYHDIVSLETNIQTATDSVKKSAFFTRVKAMGEMAQSLSMAMADYHWDIEASDVFHRGLDGIRSKL
ncbi:hypothetical protein D9615_002679 [Tricholomella constricta]|uniref:Uncharacterized protein n=1 Tax=Tricholomella constricta TaxID=117010 RepID=A0A8H5HMF0_9AGAR|nr:hypothetical protein D9615_002679 [Tricholomella constricta]